MDVRKIRYDVRITVEQLIACKYRCVYAKAPDWLGHQQSLLPIGPSSWHVTPRPSWAPRGFLHVRNCKISSITKQNLHVALIHAFLSFPWKVFFEKHDLLCRSGWEMSSVSIFKKNNIGQCSVTLKDFLALVNSHKPSRANRLISEDIA